MHGKACSEAPKLKCDHCDFKTHHKGHLQEHAKVHRQKFPCSTCGKQFGTKERLAAHEDCHERGLKCSKCPEVFKTVTTTPKTPSILIVISRHAEDSRPLGLKPGL